MGKTFIGGGMRLVSEDQVCKLIEEVMPSKYQQLIVYKISMLEGVIATNEEMLQIIGNEEIEFED